MPTLVSRVLKHNSRNNNNTNNNDTERKPTCWCDSLRNRFGHATMPIFNLFKNCSYYWGFAAFVSYFANHPLYSPPADLQWKLAFALAMACQISNFYCHIILANLRAPGDKGYKVEGLGGDMGTSCLVGTWEPHAWWGHGNLMLG
eukprot:353504-Chlamydomonas_euryale.AAC.6